ncbi:MAG: hypothetical protein LBT53_03805 [Puniceicoccales bacterium]|nr:hypothetical protein [Puniceicoccales bacterium]
MKSRRTFLALATLAASALFASAPANCLAADTQAAPKTVPSAVMEKIYNEVKTPHKYGIVLKADDKNPRIAADSPSVFRANEKWYMTYIVFDGRGYETHLAESTNLLDWKKLGKIMSFTKSTWDANQKAGYIALQDYTWGGSYSLEKHAGRYWLSYLGGAERGYEKGMLGVGVASTEDATVAKEWTRHPSPVMLPTDKDARWYDNHVIYKSTIIRDKTKTLGHEFVMFYNAKGKKKHEKHNAGVERIATAVSDDLINWKRYGDAPAVDNNSGISGDAFMAKIDDVWVMFYFGAFWKPKAFDTFACSYDLKTWTKWTGPNLVEPSEPYDNTFAHKPLVFKYKGVVYHFYNAVGKSGRCIALATSEDLGKSKIK